MDHVGLPEERSPPFHVYTPSEQAALIWAAAPHDGDPEGHHVERSEGSLYVPVAIDLGTGLRRGEPLDLHTIDVDPKQGRLHVRQALRKWHDGKLENSIVCCSPFTIVS